MYIYYSVPNRATGVNFFCVLSFISGLKLAAKLFNRLFWVFELILVKGAFTVLQPNVHTQTSQCGWAPLPWRAGGSPPTWDLDMKETQGEKFINEVGFVVFPPWMFRSDFRKESLKEKKKPRMPSQPGWEWGAGEGPLGSGCCVPGPWAGRGQAAAALKAMLCTWCPAALPTPGLYVCLH